jgi:ATP-dependent phosphoenolpyruvate carboxykinase
VLEPWSSWLTREEYDKRYKDLVLRFIQNFKKFEEGTAVEIIEAGSKV